MEAAIGVAAVLTANVLLRPVVQRINRQPVAGTEVLSSYEIRAVCREDVEERIRAVAVAAVRKANMSLLALYTEEIEGTGRTAIVADTSVAGSADAGLEAIMRTLGVESGVLGVSWKAVPTSDDERELVPDS